MVERRTKVKAICERFMEVSARALEGPGGAEEVRARAAAADAADADSVREGRDARGSLRGR